MIDITEILVHWYAGRSQHDVAGSLGMNRKTISRHLEPAIAAGFVPGGPPVSEAEWQCWSRTGLHTWRTPGCGR